MKRKGHIVMVYDAVYPYVKGGAEKRFYEIGRNLVEAGWNVSWYGVDWWGGGEKDLDGIRLVGIGKRLELREGGNARRGLRGAVGFSLGLLGKTLPDDTTAVLAGQTPWIHYFALKKLVRRRHVPIVVDCWEIWRHHWLQYYGPLLGRLGMRIERFVLKDASKLVAISNMTLESIRAVGIDGSKITVAHNGVDLSSIRQTPASDVQSDVIYFGRLVQHKNVDVLLRAVALLKLRLPALRVLVLGGGPEAEGLKRLAQDLGLADNVQFSGEIEAHVEAMAFLKSSRVFVQPSTSEGGGSIALMEAYACGLPVVAVSHPQGIDPALIVEGSTGSWSPELSPEALATRILSLLDAETNLDMRRSVAKFIEDYDWREIARRYDELFSGIANHPVQ